MSRFMPRLLTSIVISLTGVWLGLGTAHAAYIAEIEPNDDFASAQSVDAAFSLDADPYIGDVTGANNATSVPHASVEATGNDTLDYFQFAVLSPDTRIILDIDFGATGLDSALWLFHESDLFNDVQNDYDSAAIAGADGSVENLAGGLSDDSFIEMVVSSAGTYYALVGQQALGSPGYDVVPDGVSYTLHVSVDQALTHGLPVPSGLALLAVGLPWLFRRRSREARL